MKAIAIVECCRTAIAKVQRGELNLTRGIRMTAHVLRTAVQKSGMDPAEIEDVVAGCELPEGVIGDNIARNAALEAALGVCAAGGIAALLERSWRTSQRGEQR